MIQDKPRCISGVHSKTPENETLLYWGYGNTSHIPNRTAFATWNLWDGEHTVRDIAEVIRAEFRRRDTRTNVFAE